MRNNSISFKVRPRFLHVIHGTHQGITPRMIRFYDRFFPNENHAFLLYCKTEWAAPAFVPECKIEQQSIRGDPTRFRDAWRFLLTLRSIRANRLVLHGLIPYLLDWKSMFLCVCFFPDLLKRMIWIEWGGDLYQSRFPLDGLSFFKKIKRKLHERVINNFGHGVRLCIANFLPDLALFRDWFGRTDAIYLPYAGPVPEPQNDVAWINHRYPQSLKVLCGHRCTEKLATDETIRVLSGFSTENIELYIPTAEANPAYLSSVVSVAKAVFPEDKLHFIDHPMSPSELASLCRFVDIAVFSSKERQFALGTIRLLLKYHKKVFLPSDGTMRQFYREERVPVFDTEKITKMNFESFSHPVPDCSGMDKFVEQMTNVPAIAERWKAVLESTTKG